MGSDLAEPPEDAGCPLHRSQQAIWKQRVTFRRLGLDAQAKGLREQLALCKKHLRMWTGHWALGRQRLGQHGLVCWGIPCCIDWSVSGDSSAGSDGAGQSSQQPWEAEAGGSGFRLSLGNSVTQPYSVSET